MSTEKRCSHCWKDQGLDQFKPRDPTMQGYTRMCLTCRVVDTKSRKKKKEEAARARASTSNPSQSKAPRQHDPSVSAAAPSQWENNTGQQPSLSSLPSFTPLGSGGPEQTRSVQLPSAVHNHHARVLPDTEASPDPSPSAIDLHLLGHAPVNSATGPADLPNPSAFQGSVPVQGLPFNEVPSGIHAGLDTFTSFNPTQALAAARRLTSSFFHCPVCHVNRASHRLYDPSVDICVYCRYGWPLELQDSYCLGGHHEDDSWRFSGEYGVEYDSCTHCRWTKGRFVPNR